MSSPRVSVVMPCFNHERYVGDAIRSVLGQGFADLELVIIDDASSDGSWAVIEGFDDPRLRASRHPQNQGAHATLNEGMQAARGEILAIINSDDLFAPDRLERCIAAIDGGANLVGSDIELIDPQGATVAEHWWIEAFARLKAARAESGDWPATLLEGNVFMTTSNFVMSRACWERAGPFANLRFVHDYAFLLEALRAGCTLDWIDAPLLRYRLHESNTISENPLNANLEAARLLREYAPPLVAADDLLQARARHLCNQWQRTEQYVDEIHKALRHQRLVEQEANWRRMVEDRDRWIEERGQWIAQRDALIEARDRWVADRDRWIDERDARIREQGEALHERQRVIEQQQGLLAERDQQARELHAQVHDLRYSRSFRLGHALLAPARKANALLQRLAGRDGPQRVRHLAAFRRQVEQALPGVRCVSFDIFDTLLGRCVEPPELVHRRVAEALRARLDPPPPLERIEAVRREVETALRHAALQSGTDHECHFDPLIEGWVTQLRVEPDPALCSDMQALELELEATALFVKPGVRELLEWLRGKGLRVVAVSDMYLGQAHLRQLFERLGLAALIDEIYVSAEFGVGKYSGRLHQAVLQLEGLQAAQLMHVGDNLHSDALAPAKVGVRSFFLDDRRERNRRRNQSLSAEMAASGGMWPGRQFFEIVATRIANSPADHKDAFFFRYGRDVLGPAFCTFALGLVERLRAFAPERIVFLARDGYLFHRILDAWREEGFAADLPAGDYAYASRRVVSSAAVAEGMSLEQAIVAFYNPKQSGLLSVLKTYGLDPAEFTDLAAAHGFSAIDERIADWQDTRLKAFLADEAVQSRIREHGRVARELLHDYFSQIGFLDAERAALVDIGWNGTIQKFMQQTFAGDGRYPDVRGYYFALVMGMHGDFEGSERLEGLMLDMRRGNPFERASFDFEELFEQGARSPEATTIGYARDDDQVRPRLKPEDAPDRQGEIACNPLIAELQAGVLCHARHFVAAQRLTGMGFEALKPYVLGVLERAVAYPTREEVAHIRRLVHTEDFGHDHVLDLAGAPLGWRDLLSPARARRKLQLSPWPYAQVVHLATGLPAWLLRVMLLRHLRRQHGGT
ncbi:MAG: glycosyltransferase [Rhodocyclaceae bacterium]|nr:glycosyltransferase [Rhodocyclaceae bacterium]